MDKFINQADLAAIEYSGIAGCTSDCLTAIVRLLHFGDKIHHAKLLSSPGGTHTSHGFVLTINEGDQIGIKSGFTSGYCGEGPRGLADALQLLITHQIEIDEYIVDESFIERLNYSCLTSDDLKVLDNMRPKRPRQYFDYIIENRDELNSIFPASMPFHLIDERIMDLALSFSTNADAAIITAYRRLEGIIQARTGVFDKNSLKLLSSVFHGEERLLHWEDKDVGEHIGKANIFVGVFGAYRNPRAHKEIRADRAKNLREFLLVNELFLLERAAVIRPSTIKGVGVN
jgi:hypothetical protein